jgi:hypothetical protein
LITRQNNKRRRQQRRRTKIKEKFKLVRKGGGKLV